VAEGPTLGAVCESTTDDFDPKSIGLPMHPGGARTRLKTPALQSGVVNKRQWPAARMST
jgi:hypothetical protein